VRADTDNTETNLTVYLPPANPQVFQYDASGNLTNDGRRAYSWDEENQLVAIETLVSVDPSVARRRSEYVYDAQWRRIKATDYTWNPTGAEFELTSARQFVYDGWNLISEICHLPSEMQTRTNAFVWGLDLSGTLQGAGGVGGLLARISGVSSLTNTILYAYDGNGNVTDLVDANGAVVGHYDYDPFGNMVVMVGVKAVENPSRFSTKYFEAQWNLYYYGYRYYSPGVRRWVNRDPIEEREGGGLYTFVHNRPTGSWDYIGALSRSGAQDFSETRNLLCCPKAKMCTYDYYVTVTVDCPRNPRWDEGLVVIISANAKVFFSMKCKNTEASCTIVRPPEPSGLCVYTDRETGVVIKQQGANPVATCEGKLSCN